MWSVIPKNASMMVEIVLEKRRLWQPEWKQGMEKHVRRKFTRNNLENSSPRVINVSYQKIMKIDFHKLDNTKTQVFGFSFLDP